MSAAEPIIQQPDQHASGSQEHSPVPPSDAPPLIEDGFLTAETSDERPKANGFLRDLVQLTKPKILVLLLISTACPMVLAANGHVDLGILLYALLGGLLVSASASVFNCIWDRDIDAIMERTKDRPLPAGRISVATSFVYAVLLGVAGLAVLYFELNPLAAWTALFGHLFYVVIYTMLLKRTTPQNIVIGGAAGAIPPLVGYAGVTGGIDTSALLIFMVIFLWTPPHFWALAINKNADYRRARIPMMPVVAGEARTHVQMLWYALALLPTSAWLVYVNPNLGWVSGVGLLGLSALFCWKVLVLKRAVHADQEVRTKLAWDVFGFSVIYLALFFVCIVVDSALV